MKLESYSDQKLLEATKKLVVDERKITLEVIHHLREVEKRRLYSARGYPSLWEFVTSYLGYSEGAAQRRISVMRLLKAAPQLEAKVLSGRLTLSVAAEAYLFAKRHKKDALEMALLVEGKSHREARRALAALLPEPEVREGIRNLGGGLTELRLIVNEEVKAALDELLELYSHEIPTLKYSALVASLALEALRVAKAKSPPAPAVKPETPAGTGAIPAAVKNFVWQRDGGRCTYRDPISGKCCGSAHFVEFDHIQPRALGGSNDADNLRLLCREHNLGAAAAVFGQEMMNNYRAKPN